MKCLRITECKVEGNSSLFVFFAIPVSEHIQSGCNFKCKKVGSVSLSRVRLCSPMDYSPPGCSVHGILQAGTLEGVAIPFCRGSSRPRDWAPVSCTARGFFTVWATRKPLSLIQFYSAAAEFCSTHRQMLFPRTPLGGRTGQITAMVLNLCRHGDHLPNSSLRVSDSLGLRCGPTVPR